MTEMFIDKKIATKHSKWLLCFVNSEVGIIKVDKFGSKIWSYSGKDIWGRHNGESAIKILHDNLLLTDFEGKSYHLDRWGKDILK